MDASVSRPFDLLPVAVAILDEAGLVREANVHLTAVLGRRKAELHGQSVTHLLTRAAALLFQSCIWPSLKEVGYVQNLTVQLQNAQGQRIDALFSAVCGEGGEGQGVVRCVFMDLKSHGHLEELLLRAKRAADEAPGLLFQLRQPSARAQRRFVYVTEAVRRMFGLSPRQALEEGDAIWRRVHEGDLAALKASLEASAHTMKPWRCEFRRTTSDILPGTDAWTEVQASPHRESDGAIVWSGYIADISDRKALETGLRDKAAAEYASKAKSDFLSRMSHELRTPLNGILGFVQLLQMQSPGNLRDDQFNKLGYIETAGHNLLNLINEVLEISRIEAGHTHVEIDDVDLDDILQSSVRLAEPIAAARGVQLVCIGPQHLCVHADGRRLGQILLNLLSNAVKYGPADSQVTVQVQTMGHGPNQDERDDNEIAISVKDQGPGLSPEQQAQLFQPFNRLGAERGEVEGTGLGLVITRGLAELMGGRLQVCSLPGQGASFTVCLKRGADQVCDVPGCVGRDPASAEATAAEPACNGAARQRLLYVEDNPVNALLMTSLFERSPDFELEVVDTGAKAMARLRDGAIWPDGLLLDMQLPDTDGITLMQSMKALPGWHGQPVIAISANAMPEGIGQAIDAGFTDYWTKPLNIVYVQHMLHRLLAPAKA